MKDNTAQLRLQFCQHDLKTVPFYWFDGKKNRVSHHCRKCGEWFGGRPPIPQGYNEIGDFTEKSY